MSFQNCSKIIIKSIIMKMLVPSCLRLPFTVIRAVPFIKKGIAGISEGKINVSVLDAVSISASVMSGSYGTASSVMTLLNISALLEDYTRQKAKNAAQVVQSLKNKGFSDIMMITGDGETTAKNVCDKLGIEKFYAHVLPEDKLNIVNSIQNKSHKVVMVGDGINDSPALAAADVSVAMKDASDIAREVADITLLSSNLDCLVVLRNVPQVLKVKSEIRT